MSAFYGGGVRPRVIAHRGFSAAAPENTLAAFRAALDLGVDMIELDVLLSRDGVPVVIHDATLERTTSGAGPVAAQTLAELRELDAGSWFGPGFARQRVPTLAEVLELAGGVPLNVEIKREAVTHRIAGGITERVLRVVREHGSAGSVLLSSFDRRALMHARQIDADVARAVLVGRRMRLDPLALVAELGAVALHLERSAATPRRIAACHRSGCAVAVYTVDEPADLRRMIELEVDGVFTNWPERLLALQGRNVNRSPSE